MVKQVKTLLDNGGLALLLSIGATILTLAVSVGYFLAEVRALNRSVEAMQVKLGEYEKTYVLELKEALKEALRE